VVCRVCQGHQTRERLPETGETGVVRLITQRQLANSGLMYPEDGAAESASERQSVADRGTSRGTGGHGIPVQSVPQVRFGVLSVQVTARHFPVSWFLLSRQRSCHGERDEYPAAAGLERRRSLPKKPTADVSHAAPARTDG
jgi:hypothetical protein